MRRRAPSLRNFVCCSQQYRRRAAATRLDRQFNATEPDKVWAGDTTYIATDEGWLFLAVVIDLFSCQVVGWFLREDMKGQLVIDGLCMAWFRRRPDKQAGLIFHSDRGSQYAIQGCAQAIRHHQFDESQRQLLGQRLQRNVVRMLKVERLHGQRFKSRRQAKDETLRWLFWYNRERLHLTLTYVSPMQYERDWRLNQPSKASS